MENDSSDHSVIGSDRVEGTSVYGADGDKIGTVRRVMIDKLSGQARDVEIAVGTFLGMGGELHSLPWEKFAYDEQLQGYRLEVTADQLREAPTYRDDERDRQYDRAFQARVYDYWAIPPYW